ncbi:hypothetical protein Trydic_g10819, partial [Trypoxylus dichotomus]
MKLNKANELMQKCKTNATRKPDTRCCGCRTHQNYRDPPILVSCSAIFEPNTSQERWQQNCDRRKYGVRPPPVTWGKLTRPRYFTKEDISRKLNEENKLRSKSEIESILEKQKLMYSILQITNQMAAKKEKIEDDDSSSISEDVFECNEHDKQEDDEENSGDTGIIQLEENKKEEDKKEENKKEEDKKEEDKKEEDKKEENKKEEDKKEEDKKEEDKKEEDVKEEDKKEEDKKEEDKKEEDKKEEDKKEEDKKEEDKKEENKKEEDKKEEDKK